VVPSRPVRLPSTDMDVEESGDAELGNA
jgi:hypothetical protein